MGSTLALSDSEPVTSQGASLEFGFLNSKMEIVTISSHRVIEKMELVRAEIHRNNTRHTVCLAICDKMGSLPPQSPKSVPCLPVFGWGILWSSFIL